MLMTYQDMWLSENDTTERGCHKPYINKNKFLRNQLADINYYANHFDNVVCIIQNTQGNQLPSSTF